MAITYSGGVITVSGAKVTGTSTGGSTTTLVDTSKSWTVDVRCKGMKIEEID